MADAALDQAERSGIPDRSLAKKPRIGETIIEGSLLLAGIISVAVTIGIVIILVKDAIAFFQLPEVTLLDFFTDTVWQPQIGRFGIIPLLNFAIGIKVGASIALIIYSMIKKTEMD